MCTGATPKTAKVGFVLGHLCSPQCQRAFLQAQQRARVFPASPKETKQRGLKIIEDIVWKTIPECHRCMFLTEPSAHRQSCYQREIRAQNYLSPRSLPYPEHDRNSTVQKMYTCGPVGRQNCLNYCLGIPAPPITNCIAGGHRLYWLLFAVAQRTGLPSSSLYSTDGQTDQVTRTRRPTGTRRRSRRGAGFSLAAC